MAALIAKRLLVSGTIPSRNSIRLLGYDSDKKMREARSQKVSEPQEKAATVKNRIRDPRPDEPNQDKHNVKDPLVHGENTAQKWKENAKGATETIKEAAQRTKERVKEIAKEAKEGFEGNRTGKRTQKPSEDEKRNWEQTRSGAAQKPNREVGNDPIVH